jgi:hypothetical protein
MWKIHIKWQAKSFHKQPTDIVVAVAEAELFLLFFGLRQLQEG